MNAPPRRLRQHRVLMATTSYPSDAADWKGRFIYDLAASLQRTGHVDLLLWGPPGELPAGVDSAISNDDKRLLSDLAARGGIAHLLRKHPVSGLRYGLEILSRLRKAGQRVGPALHHVAWLQLALGLPSDGKPVYASVLGTDFGLLRLRGMKSMLRRVFKARPTILAPNADWMMQRLSEDFGDIVDIRPNPFGVSPQLFDVERNPATPHEWIVVSRVTRKKLGDLLDWGSTMFSATRPLRLLGPMQEQIELPDWIDYRGPTEPRDLRERWFPRAAGLLTLSRHDEGRPQVMIEAMAAGVPVIASRIPAHADLIRHGETGWLVDSASELAAALDEAEQHSVADSVGTRATHWIRETIGTWDDHAARCVNAYRDLVETGMHG